MQLSINYSFILGIDISKLTLDIYLLDRCTGANKYLQVSNDGQGFEQIGQWLKEEDIARNTMILCSEYTGRYSEHLLAWSAQNKWHHAVIKTTALKKVNPEHHRKTDAFDAKQIAEYGHRFTDKLRLYQPSSPTVKQLNRLQSERRAMVKHRTSLKQKHSEAEYHDACMEQIQRYWEQQTQLLTTHISQLEKQIKQLIREDTPLHSSYQLMRSAPGVGPVLGCLWLTLFAGQQQLNPRQISSRFGFAPHPFRSGSSVHKSTRSSGFGNSEMRKILHQAAQSVACHNPHYRAYYQRKKAEGKPHLIIINNIINKLIRLYCAMWNNRVEYDSDYIQKNTDAIKKSA